ncbi:hypothetical protein GE061_010577 [Apolygus lucorum]|uniref:Uncharacterized protein n=1 Tax=Apolygus lucorum TaxID=248454 RepID=A0A6A4K8G7_APOLU|nr:hypothetical protein GE061_010577 [Apolygus lucorum]
MKAVTVFFLLVLSYSSYANEEMFVRRQESDGRVAYIKKRITAADFADGTPLTADVESHAKKLSAPGDVIIQLIDAKIGGAGNSTDNALPMNPSLQEFWKTNVTDEVRKYLTEHKTEELLMEVIPFYDNLSTKRPNAFSCFVVKMTESIGFLVKALIPNPPKSTSPFVYSAGNLRRFEGTTGIHFTTRVIEKYGDRPFLSRTEMASKIVKLSDVTGNKDEIWWFCREWTKPNSYLSHAEQLCGYGQCKGETLFVSRLIPLKIAGDNMACNVENVVPMVPKAVEEFRNRVEAPILDFFKDPAHKDNTTTLTVVVQYSSDSTGRPVGFTVLNDILPDYRLVGVN